MNLHSAMQNAVTLAYPTIFGPPAQQAAVLAAFGWLEADWLHFDRSSWAVDFVCRNSAEIHCVQGYGFFGAAPAPGIIAITTAALDCPDWLVASVIVHECNHQAWLRRRGTALNSRAEELDCLEQQKSFLYRVGQPSDWMLPLFQAALHLPG